MVGFYSAEGATEGLLVVSGLILAGASAGFKIAFVTDIFGGGISGAIPSWAAFVAIFVTLVFVFLISALVYVIELVMKSDKPQDGNGILPF